MTDDSRCVRHIPHAGEVKMACKIPVKYVGSCFVIGNLEGTGIDQREQQEAGQYFQPQKYTDIQAVN